MKEHYIKTGNLSVICDLEKAEATLKDIDARIEKDIQLLEKKYIKGRKVKIVSLILTIFFIVLLILALRANSLWLSVVSILFGILSMYVFLNTLIYKKNFKDDLGFQYEVHKIEEYSYPMSVKFLILQKNVEVFKAKLSYVDNNENATLSLYWADEDGIVHKKDFGDLYVKYKKGIIHTTVDLDEECVIRPFVDSTEF